MDKGKVVIRSLAYGGLCRTQADALSFQLQLVDPAPEPGSTHGFVHFASPLSLRPSLPFPSLFPAFPTPSPPLMDPIHLDGSSTSAPYDQIEIDDDEEDQLASDTDEPPQIVRAPGGEELEPDPDDEEAREGGRTQSTSTPATNGKRKHPRKTGDRVAGHTLLPATRLENILRADGSAPSLDSVTSLLLTAVL